MGMITATTGSILVEMKKNSTSEVFFTGRMLRAYDAGTASTMTSTVESPVAMSELRKYAPAPLASTASNCSNVGTKKNTGGLEAAADSGLNAVMTSQITGAKNTKASSHVRVVMLEPAKRRRASRD